MYAPSMSEAYRTPFQDAYDGQTLEEAFDSTVKCARALDFWRDFLPDVTLESLEDFKRLPLASRAELSRATGLRELITDPRWLMRSFYPYNQNVCTFPFQVVAGEEDLILRHERIKAILETTGFDEGGEALILVSPPQYFFGSDLCAEIYFDGPHCNIQDVTGMEAAAIRERIEDFGAQLVIVATDSQEICPDAFPSSVEAVVTFRGAFPELAELDAKVVDVYTLTECPIVGHRLAGERFYGYDHDHYYIERSPAGLITITTLLWEAMPFVRYQTYDTAGEILDAEGEFEVTAFGEW